MEFLFIQLISKELGPSLHKTLTFTFPTCSKDDGGIPTLGTALCLSVTMLHTFISFRTYGYGQNSERKKTIKMNNAQFILIKRACRVHLRLHRVDHE